MRTIITIILFLLLMWNIAAAQSDTVDRAQLEHEDRIVKAVILAVLVVIGIVVVLIRLFQSPRGYQPIDTLDTSDPPRQKP